MAFSLLYLLISWSALSLFKVKFAIVLFQVYNQQNKLLKQVVRENQAEKKRTLARLQASLKLVCATNTWLFYQRDIRLSSSACRGGFTLIRIFCERMHSTKEYTHNDRF